MKRNGDTQTLLVGGGVKSIDKTGTILRIKMLMFGILMSRGYEKPSKEVSERMKKVKSKGTKLEKAMEEILKELGIPYEKQIDLPGKPDFKIKESNVLIFCDSSFWHGRRPREISGEAFTRNREFWTKRLNDNHKRDQRINRKLRAEGWSVHRFWDTDILRKSDKVVRRIKRILDARKR